MNREELPFAPACERNKQPIFEALKTVLPAAGTVLEIGSGTGQHIVYFAAQLPGLTWQPSDRSENLPGIRARLRLEALENLRPPIELDVLEKWPDRYFDAVYSANTTHIMGWEGVCALFDGVGKCLAGGGVFCLYGPFNEGGAFTSPSNAAFNQQLKRRDPAMGIRDIEALESLAGNHNTQLENRFAMPANNQLLVFRVVMQSAAVG